jgi:hypothetical protein
VFNVQWAPRSAPLTRCVHASRRLQNSAKEHIRRELSKSKAAEAATLQSVLASSSPGGGGVAALRASRGVPLMQPHDVDGYTRDNEGNYLQTVLNDDEGDPRACAVPLRPWSAIRQRSGSASPARARAAVPAFPPQSSSGVAYGQLPMSPMHSFARTGSSALPRSTLGTPTFTSSLDDSGDAVGDGSAAAPRPAVMSVFGAGLQCAGEARRMMPLAHATDGAIALRGNGTNAQVLDFDRVVGAFEPKTRLLKEARAQPTLVSSRGVLKKSRAADEGITPAEMLARAPWGSGRSSLSLRVSSGSTPALLVDSIQKTGTHTFKVSSGAHEWALWHIA